MTQFLRTCSMGADHVWTWRSNDFQRTTHVTRYPRPSRSNLDRRWVPMTSEGRVTRFSSLHDASGTERTDVWNGQVPARQGAWWSLPSHHWRGSLEVAESSSISLFNKTTAAKMATGSQLPKVLVKLESAFAARDFRMFILFLPSSLSLYVLFLLMR